MKIHHYGLAVKNIEKSMEVFRLLGYEVGDVIIDPTQKVQLSFIKPPSGALIELVCDRDENGPTSRLVNKQGSGFYHVCFEVDDMEQAIKDFKCKKYSLLHQPTAAVAFDGREIAWMYHQDIGLIELLEAEGSVLPEEK